MNLLQQIIQNHTHSFRLRIAPLKSYASDCPSSSTKHSNKLYNETKAKLEKIPNESIVL